MKRNQSKEIDEKLQVLGLNTELDHHIENSLYEPKLFMSISVFATFSHANHTKVTQMV